MQQAPPIDEYERFELVISDPKSTSYIVDLAEIFTFDSLIGAGSYGIVAKASVTQKAIEIPALPSVIKTGVFYAIKLQAGDGPAENSAQTEARLAALLRRTEASTENIAKTWFWMRVASAENIQTLDTLEKEVELSVILMATNRRSAAHDSFTKLRTAQYIHVTIMEYYAGGGFYTLVPTLKKAKTNVELYASAAHVVAAFAILRTIIPDFKHNDCKTDNIFLERQINEGLALLYQLEDVPFDLCVPLFLTHGYVLKLGDFGLSSGTYVSKSRMFKVGNKKLDTTFDLSLAFPDLMPFPDTEQQFNLLYYHTLLTNDIFKKFRCEKGNPDARFFRLWNKYQMLPMSKPEFILLPILRRLSMSPIEIKARIK
jgi:serine/threonine protein kinase